MEKKIKTLIILVLFLSSFIATFLFYSSDVCAFRNYNPKEVVNPNLGDWKSYNYDTDYATHDWLPHIALDILLASSLAGKWGNFWSEARIKILLYATAAPDLPDVSYIDNEGVKHPKRYHGDTGYHNVRFDNNTRQRIIMSDAVQRAEYYGNEAALALQNGDCNVAAFYLGCLSHMIADPAGYPHVIFVEGGYHQNFESRMAERTDCTLSTKAGKYDINQRYEVFRIKEDFNIGKKSGYYASEDVSYDTRFDSRDRKQVGIYRAEWMDSNYIKMSGIWPKTRSEWQEWINGSGDTLICYYYMNRIEKSLQYAVENIAATLNFYSDYYDDCSDDEEEEKEKELRQMLITKWVYYTLIFALIAIPSTVTALFAVSYVGLAQKTDSPILVVVKKVAMTT
ncbi:MAG: hypothetical protein ACFFAN_12875 [Promethearchaeota archaeon]